MRSIIDESISTFSFGESGRSKARVCRILHISASQIRGSRNYIDEDDGGRILLLLAGTSLTFSDSMELMLSLLESGYGLAAIENRVGGLLDLGINPKKERLEVLDSFIEYLQKHHGVKGIDIIAHSYAAFEVVRLLSSHPAKYIDLVKSVILVNPAGFNKELDLLTHSGRFIFGHILKAYGRRFKILPGMGGFASKNIDLEGRQYIQRDFHGVNTWAFKTFKNPARAIKELVDIAAYDISAPLAVLQTQYGYDFHLFLQSEDELLPIKYTLKHARRIIADSNINVVPGRHNDLFYQLNQRQNFIDVIKRIRRLN